jgi:hypothetical protein
MADEKSVGQAENRSWYMCTAAERFTVGVVTLEDILQAPKDSVEIFKDPAYIPRIGEAYFLGQARYKIIDIRWSYENHVIVVVLGD